MKPSKSPWAVGLLLLSAAAFSNTGCHYARDTAGRPEMEDQSREGSTAATKEGTGDPKVGSGAGQVGTDAPPKPEAAEKPGESPK